jgi:flagellar basal-body rod protein FlgG
MIQAIYTGNTGLRGTQTFIDVTGNNLANINTNGFKTGRVNFADLVYRTVQAPGAPTGQGTLSPIGTQFGFGTIADSTELIVTEGPLQNTGGSLDVAINGNGFFQLALPGGGIGYTRDGAFQVGPTGRLLGPNGEALLPPITVPAGATVSISANGTVTATLPGPPTTSVFLGQLTLAKFPNPPGLTSMGTNVFAASPDSGTPTVVVPGQGGAGTLQQGFLEGSNVDQTTELTNLIIGQQTFAANSETITVANEMLLDTLNVFSTGP